MKNREGGFRRMVLRVKPKSDPPPRVIPKRMFLGIRHKNGGSVLPYSAAQEGGK